MRQGPVRHALEQTAGGAVVLVAVGLLLGGCSTGDDGVDDEGVAASTAAAPSTPPPGSDPGATQPPEQSQEPDMTEQPGTTRPEPPTTAQPSTTDAAVLTEQDSGSLITLAVGEERPLQLGSAWSWSEPVVDGAAVTLTPVDFLVDPGYVEWLVTGASAGSATLEVVGEPVCGDTTVCPPTTVTLDVEVTG